MACPAKTPRAGELVNPRFAELTLVQAAEALGIGRRTADRDWAYAAPGSATPWPGPIRRGSENKNLADLAPGPQTEH